MNHFFSTIKSCSTLILILLSVLRGFCNEVEGKVQDVSIIKNLNNDLLIYDEELQNYLPYIPGSSLNFPTLSYYLNLNLYSGYKIQHCVPPGSSLFIDQKIVDVIEHASCKTYSIDSLRNIYEHDTLFITLYNSSLTAKNLKVSIVSERIHSTGQEEKAAGFLNIVSREFTGFNDFFIVGLLLLMGFIAILYNKNTKYFHEFYNLPKAVSFKIREESYISVKNISGAYLLFLFVHSFLLGFIALTFLHYHEEFRNLIEFVNTNEFRAAFLSWVQVSMLIFGLLIAKYILVKSISQLFNINGFSTIHYFDFIRMSISFFLLVLIVFCILLLAFRFEEQFWFQPLINSIIIFYIARIIVLFFKLYRYAPFRKLHLFLYICSTELIPLMIGFKIFIK